MMVMEVGLRVVGIIKEYRAVQAACIRILPIKAIIVLWEVQGEATASVTCRHKMVHLCSAIGS